MAHFLAPLLRAEGRKYGLRLQRTGRLVASELETAFDSRSRRRGLLGRPGLEAGRALVIAPCSSIHTAFMRFPIDVVFVGRDGRVVKVAPSMPPWRMSLAWRAFAVIELPAGAACPAGLRRGDRVELVALG